MKIITTVRSNNIETYMNMDVDALMLGLKNYTTYLDYSFDINAIRIITSHKGNKEIYVLVNRIIENTEIEETRKILKELASLNIDGIVILDMGLLQIAKEEHMLNKIVFSPSTYITNKDTAAYFSSYGIKRLSPSREISLNNILEIKNNIKCEMEVMVYGHRNIFYSKRHLLDLYNENYHTDVKVSYLKEEKRESLFPIKQNEQGTFVYSEKPLNLIKYLDKFIENNIDYINLESNFIDEKELSKVATEFRNAINIYYDKEAFYNYINSLDIDDSDDGFINRDSVYMQEEY